MSAPEMSFHGRLASQHRRTFSAELLQRLDSLGADGFTFDIDSLFSWEPVDDKHPWHVHCIFSVLEQSAGTPGYVNEVWNVNGGYILFFCLFSCYRELFAEQIHK